jgi:hypothetical protein
MKKPNPTPEEDRINWSFFGATSTSAVDQAQMGSICLTELTEAVNSLSAVDGLLTKVKRIVIHYNITVRFTNFANDDFKAMAAHALILMQSAGAFSNVAADTNYGLSEALAANSADDFGFAILKPFKSMPLKAYDLTGAAVLTTTLAVKIEVPARFVATCNKFASAEPPDQKLMPIVLIATPGKYAAYLAGMLELHYTTTRKTIALK